VSKIRRDVRWFRQEEPHFTVFEVANKILERTDVLRQSDLYHCCLYDDSSLSSLGSASFDYSPQSLAFNVVRPNVDTLAAKIAKNQPLPTPITSGGSYRQKRRAKKFAKAIEGQFDLAGVWRTSPVVARDTALFGTGIVHNYRVGRTICHERVFPWEVLVDPREGTYGRPRNLYMQRWVDRFVLAERFPDFEEEILNEETRLTSETFDLGYDDDQDLVLVIEAWHLPSRVLEDDDKAEHDGKHVICIGGATLFEEEWRRQYFPFSILRMQDPVFGWHGTGIAKQLTGLQFTINQNASYIQDAYALSGGFVMVEAGSNLDVDKLGNNPATVLKYTGTQPSWINPPAVNPEHWSFVLSLLPRANELSGVSALSARSEKPAGIESALALNTYNDIETERFALFAKQYEEYHVDVAWQFFDLMEEIHEEYGDLQIRVASRERGSWNLQTIDYEGIRLDRNQFTLKVYPTSLLSKKPSARIQEVENLANAGWIGPDEAKMLLDFPDLDRMFDLGQASRRVIEAAIEKMLDADDANDPDVYTYPEAAFDLNLCIKLGLLMYLDAKLLDEPPAEENLSLVLQFVEDARAMLAEGTGQPPPGEPGADPAAAAAAPPGDPMMDPAMMDPAMAGVPPMGPEMAGPPMEQPMPPEMMPPPEAMAMPPGAAMQPV
jgi:hypothetical protein